LRTVFSAEEDALAAALCELQSEPKLQSEPRP
jgi:hypothetical protein